MRKIIIPGNQTHFAIIILICAIVAAIFVGFLLHVNKSDKSKYPTSNNGIYAALGDSVAAGSGLSTYPNSDRETLLCSRSPESYAAIIADKLNMTESFIYAACGGATTAHLSGPQNIEDSQISPQLDVAFRSGTPSIITLTIGGNDVRWADFISTCFTASCDTDTQTEIALTYLQTLEKNLGDIFENIEARSKNNHPDVFVTGYYHVVSEACVNNYLTSGEVIWLNTQTNNLNQTLQKIAQKFGSVQFVDIDFTGHDICSNEPWVQKFGNGSALFHPNILGQKEIARSVLKALNR
jgi:lysophospholipase L1-like esterase